MDDALSGLIVFAEPFVSTVAEMAIQGDLFCTLPIFHRTLLANRSAVAIYRGVPPVKRLFVALAGFQITDSLLLSALLKPLLSSSMMSCINDVVSCIAIAVIILVVGFVVHC